MRKVFFLGSAGMLFTILGCSGNAQQAVSSSAPVVAEASATPASPSLAVVPSHALPLPPLGVGKQPTWRAETVSDVLGNAVALEGTSLDGKFDFVILEKGTHSFLSFVRHARWESVYNRPAKGKLMYLRVKFDDGREKRVEWDELGFGTDNLYSVLWRYPAEAHSPIGPVREERKGDPTGGDQLLLQDMMKHKTMTLEFEPGVTTKIDVTGLAAEMAKARALQTQPVLEALQTGP